jgi:hypothetical protein
MGHINGLVNWIFKPLLVILKLLFYPFRRLFATGVKSSANLDSHTEPADSTRTELV